MLRLVIVNVLICVVLSSAVVWADSSLTDEVTEFINHRNVLLSIEFAFGSHKLDENAQKALGRIGADLKSLLGDHKVVRIEGYANPIGKEDYNLVLSMERAMEVQKFLHEQYGLELDLYFNGFGSSRAPADTVVQLAFYDDTLGLTAAQVGSVETH